VGGCGQKIVDSKHTWSPDLVEFLFEEEVVEFVLPPSKLLKDDTNEK
jgi:hypothetical protein